MGVKKILVLGTEFMPEITKNMVDIIDTNNIVTDPVTGRLIYHKIFRYA